MTITKKTFLAWAPLALIVSGLLWADASLLADSKRLVEPNREHKKKSTIENFPFQQMKQEDLAEAVIEGGLEPPAAGEVSVGEQTAAASEETIGLEERDRRTDFEHQTTTVQFNFKMPRYTPPGTTIIQSTEFNRSNRSYNGVYDVGTSSVR